MEVRWILANLQFGLEPDPGTWRQPAFLTKWGFFTEALSEDEINNVMEEGLMQIASVDPTTKLAISWGKIKRTIN